jgi:hypothetical protein
MNFPKWMGVAVAAAALSVVGYAAEGEADLKVQVSGLQVVSRVNTDETLRPFSSPSGTTVALLIASEKAGLIQFDPENSTLSRFTDDKGNDLLTRTEVDKGAAQPGFSMFPKVSPDGKFCALDVFAPSRPAKGSTRIKVEGVVTMLCASEKTETVVKDVAIKNSTKLTAAGIELTLDNVGKPDFGDEPLSVTLRAHAKLDNVAEIKFCKADGTEIKSHRTGSSKMAILGSLTVEWTYSLAEKADVAQIKVYIWKDLEKKKVPFKLDVDVGL